MKTCPDCAESVQEAARKCRFCGYRFDAEGGDAAGGSEAEAMVHETPAPAATPATKSPTAVAWFGLAAGGAAVAVGGGAGALAALLGREQTTPAIAWANVGGLVVGGVVLALGWLAVAVRTGTGFGGLFGGLALAAGQVIAVLLGGGEANAMMQGLLAGAGMACCLFLHLGALEEHEFAGPRLAAMLGLVGVGGELFSFVKQWELAPWIWQAFAWCGLGGVVLFGLSLAVAATLRCRAV